MEKPYNPLTPRWTPMREHPEQLAVRRCRRQDNVRIITLPCGRRSGKSELAKRLVVESLLDVIPGCHKPRYIYAGPTQDQAREIAWHDLLDLIPDHWILGGKSGPNVSYSRLSITIANGASVRVVGLDKPHRIEGGYLNGFVGDEWSDIRPGTFDRVIRPMLGDFHGWAILCGVPKRQGVGAAWYRRLCEAIAGGKYPDAAHFRWPASDILPAEEVAEARSTMDPKDYAEQYDAIWQTAGGGIFHAFSREHNVRPCQRRDNLPIIVGSDFNIDPMCWVIGHRVDDRLEIFDELFIRDCNTPRALDELWKRWGHHPGGWQFYGDASSRARKTSAVQSDYAHIWNDPRFKKAGRTLHYPPDNPNVEDRFSAMNARFCNAEGVRRVFIDEQCVHLTEDLETRSYKLGSREPNDSHDQGHSSDALSYVAWRIWPLRFNVGNAGRQSVIVGTAAQQLTSTENLA